MPALSLVSAPIPRTKQEKWGSVSNSRSQNSVGGRPNYLRCAKYCRIHLSECLLGKRVVMGMASWAMKLKIIHMISREVGIFILRLILLMHQLIQVA